MDYFSTIEGVVHCEGVSLAEIAKQHQTPCYVYSRATVERHWHAFDAALNGVDHQVCYAVKANSNLAVLNLLARLGSGFDIVSGGELERVLTAGGEAKKIVFSGVAKTEDEIARALEVGIHCFNIESSSELAMINQIAERLGKTAPVSIRVNPDVDAGTHPYISTGLKENKFGVDINQAITAYQQANKLEFIDIIGVDCHIGSQLTEVQPFVDALDRVLVLVDDLEKEGITLSHIDLGGGLGVTYDDETPPEPADYANAIKSRLMGRAMQLIIEPGRAIVANAGVLLTTVKHIKSNEQKNFAIVDAGMNDLLRPSLYQAWQKIIPVREREKGAKKVYDVVGPVCETGDFLGKGRELNISAEDVLAVRSSGAYGFTMSSNYNSRPRAAEVMVDGSNSYLVRRRETVEELYAHEQLLPT